MITCEIHYAQKNKSGELVCGDAVYYKHDENKMVVSVSDGLGSGVKANILATLTASIATTMVFNDVGIEDAFKSILKTLPVCKVRGISYATLATCKIEYAKKKCFIFEYEFPVVLVYKGVELLDIPKKSFYIEGKKLQSSEFDVDTDFSIFLMTDGITQAGMGTDRFPLGFGLENVKKELDNLLKNKVDHKSIAEHFVKLVEKLDRGTKGDDATVVALKIREKRIVTIMVGPPEKKENDVLVVNKLINSPGKKIVCGGTTGKIVERVLGKPIEIDIQTIYEDSPPVGKMEGIDLVTEGIITLTQVFRYFENQTKDIGYAARLIVQELENADVINFLVGRAINPAHQNPLFAHDISLKFRLINDLAQRLRELGKIVNIEYY
ncbi:SpoIIE family protein phosphatase [Pseudothermotoga thermarum]|uniref:Stage II sporulation protein E n=1 Tax=Pseudothermotoga thermarum DSM 5069 TaxID=688269 RepID=F7YUM1_9THEM|nr:SpoIIE family protein phosphatase [Pseudothermotoga thermarum]AEH50206.1 Stage II sporulation protein E [Pseudothermotoga thermarum DSM 5069]